MSIWDGLDYINFCVEIQTKASETYLCIWMLDCINKEKFRWVLSMQESIHYS